MSNTTKLIAWFTSQRGYGYSPTTQPKVEYCILTTKPNPSVVWLPNKKFSAVVWLPNPKFSIVVGLPNPKMNPVVRLPNPKLSTVVWLPNPKFKTMGAGYIFLRIQNLFMSSLYENWCISIYIYIIVSLYQCVCV